MSSLQKFHRRTNNAAAAAAGWVLDTVLTDSAAPTVGGDGTGSATMGYWLGNVNGFKLRVAPKSTEVTTSWGSYGTVRGTSFVNNGWANTNKLYTFGTTGHPAAGVCTSLSTGGYNTWYLPSKNELNTLYSSKAKTPFATADSFVGSYYWSSTESNGGFAWLQNFSDGNQYTSHKNNSLYGRAVRRSLI